MNQERERKTEKEKESERKIRKEEKSRKGIEVWEKERILDIEEYSKKKKKIDVRDWKGSRQKLRERIGEKENEINENEGEKWVMSWLFKER